MTVSRTASASVAHACGTHAQSVSIDFAEFGYQVAPHLSTHSIQANDNRLLGDSPRKTPDGRIVGRLIPIAAVH